MEDKIRVSTRYLGIQIFTLFINPTGWDSIGFSFPFWILYIFIRGSEKGGGGILRIGKRAIKETRFLLYWLLLNILFAFVYFQEAGAVKLAFYYLVGVSFFFSILDAKLSKRELSWLLRMYVTMALAASALLFMQRVQVPTYTNRWTIAILGQTKDPNYFSAYLMFPFLICFYKYIKGNGKAFICSAIIVGAILLTGSRSSFLALSLGCLVIVVYNLKYVHSFSKIMLMAMIAVLVLFLIMPDDLIIRLIDLKSYNDGSNRLRYNIWTAAAGIWKDHILFGGGQNVVVNYGTDYGAYLHMMAHNTYLDILAEFGLIGFLLFFSVPVGMLFVSWKQKNIPAMAGIVTTLATSLVISAQYSQYYWFNMALCYSLLKSNSFQKKAAKEGSICYGK